MESRKISKLIRFKATIVTKTLPDQCKTQTRRLDNISAKKKNCVESVD